jgi:hypothetical protein
MYTLLLYLHSYNRWLVLLAAAVALWTSWRGWLGGGAWGRTEDIAARAFRGLLDLQVLLGLVLYGLSPIVRTALGDLNTAMSVKELRFFGVEHITGMLIALAFLHAGSARIRRAPTNAAQLRQAAIWQTLAAVSILVSIPWWRPLVRV